MAADNLPLAGRQLYGSEKKENIEEILNVLDLDKMQLSTLESNKLLEQLRIHTTSLDSLDPLLTKRGVSLCCRHAFMNTSRPSGRIALRCLCNILLLAAPTRQIFVDENYLEEVTGLMKNNNTDDEFLSARLLLLCTYGTNMNFDILFEKYHVGVIINNNISRQAKLITRATAKSPPTCSAISACSESLKLLYNLTAHCPHQAPVFIESLLPILKILNKIDITSPPLQPPVSLLINSLVHLDLYLVEKKRHYLFPEFNGNLNVDRLISILDLALRAYDDKEMDEYGSPLVQVLLRIAESAPPNPREHLKALLLPSSQDHERVLGRGDSLPARLLRLSTSPMAPRLRELIPALLFELSDKDAKLFMDNIGYGFAAGFLTSKGLKPSANVLKACSTGGDGDSITTAASESTEFNPITGQRLDMEPKLHIPEMTDNEKEREAERLFVLFERLRATGIIDVENPVAQAVQEGRFEEVD